jgi:hypothetical protein
MDKEKMIIIGSERKWQRHFRPSMQHDAISKMRWLALVVVPGLSRESIGSIVGASARLVFVAPQIVTIIEAIHASYRNASGLGSARAWCPWARILKTWG